MALVPNNAWPPDAATVTTAAGLATIDATWAFVQSYKSYFYLDTITVRTAVADVVIAGPSPTSWWVRLDLPDPYWAAQTAWYIDPAGTNPTPSGAPGNDEASGLVATAPIKSTAEWRRRIKGVNYPNISIVLNALSSSAIADDGVFSGFTGGTVIVRGPTTVLFTGTVTSYQPYSGNTRGSITDSAIPVSWTASGGVSTSSGSRYIRKVGTFQQAPLLKDMGAKTAMIGLPIVASETAWAVPPQTTTDFVVGDAYEVTVRLQWPKLSAAANAGTVWYQCVDIAASGVFISPSRYADRFILCGFLTAATFGNGYSVASVCVFLGGTFGYTSNGSLNPVSSAFVGSPLVLTAGIYGLNTISNVFVASEVRVWHGGQLTPTGTMRCFDNITYCLSVRHGGRALIQALVGDGNTGKLIIAGDSGGNQVYGGATATAITTDALPYSVSGTSYAAPTVDMSTGDGIYG